MCYDSYLLPGRSGYCKPVPAQNFVVIVEVDNNRAAKALKAAVDFYEANQDRITAASKRQDEEHNERQKVAKEKHEAKLRETYKDYFEALAAWEARKERLFSRDKSPEEPRNLQYERQFRWFPADNWRWAERVTVVRKLYKVASVACSPYKVTEETARIISECESGDYWAEDK